MQEKILIKSEKYNVKRLFIILLIIDAIIATGMFFYWMQYNLQWHELMGYRYSDPFKYALERTFFDDGLFAPVIIFPLIGALLYFWLRGYELTVTNKRIYGKVEWGRRVDLPVDSISASSTVKIFKGISVSTSSGIISFLNIKNADEIYKIISNLLVERQTEKIEAPVIAETPKIDEIDQIKRYKELLDSGILTQEEFDVKKKQLLGL